MFAIEFEATIENGMIPIPSQYLAQLHPPVKVIVMQEESAGIESPKLPPCKRKDEFLAKLAQQRFALPQDYRFKREELYGRV